MLKCGFPRFLLAAFFLAAACSLALSGFFAYPLPSAGVSPRPDSIIADMTGVLAGMRRLAADIAWVQMLQYYGTPEKPLDRETEYRLSWDMTRYLAGVPVKDREVCREPGCSDPRHYHPQIEGGVYPELLSRCYRVVRLDPFFHYAYLYGAGALAWNLNRPGEAMALLKDGIAAMERYRSDSTRDIHQPYWQYHLYLSAIIYRQSGEFDKMVSLLETAARQPGAPNMVKSILANIYQKDRNLPRSLELWIDIYESGDPTYRKRAGEKIAELKNILRM